MTAGEAVRRRILALCEERSITINRLSILSGVTQSTLNNIMSGRNHTTTVATVKKLCDGLNITVDEFFCPEYFHDLEQELNKTTATAVVFCYAANEPMPLRQA